MHSISSSSPHHSALAVYLLFYILLACTYLVDKIRRRTIKGFKLELLLHMKSELFFPTLGTISIALSYIRHNHKPWSSLGQVSNPFYYRMLFDYKSIIIMNIQHCYFWSDLTCLNLLNVLCKNALRLPKVSPVPTSLTLITIITNYKIFSSHVTMAI